MRNEPVAEEDFPLRSRLMHALVSLHLEGAHVDVFATDGGGDFMTFDSHLCCLWYEFAKKLGKVRIGYCAQCEEASRLPGTGASSGASAARCKTKAKNERAGALRDEARARFFEASPSPPCPRSLFPKTIPFVRKSASSRICGDGRSFSTSLDAAVVFEGSRQGFF